MPSEKNIVIVDANVILRYLLKDHEEFYKKAEELFDAAMDGKISVRIFQSVIAEVVYVLLGLYKVRRAEIAEALRCFLNIKAIKVNDKQIVINALEIFRITNLDFVDALLCSYGKNFPKVTIVSFDKGVNKCIEGEAM